MLIDMFPLCLQRKGRAEAAKSGHITMWNESNKHIRKLPIFDHPNYRLLERIKGPAVPVISNDLGLTTSEIDSAE